ncbi:TRAP transporter permease [Microaerobacter geothermalis]|uniref:TRAP transporter permease n=1 Tax=Microaerobacter geothermalis TaxID=674972 RepID=UPI001F3AC9D6|nr:TRAP transporter permease [Microaerobacter geothermalis]MCF6094852.1 TRAP transporter permease [Microaerobacter geothermalis]
MTEKNQQIEDIELLSKSRDLKGIFAIITSIIAISMSIFQLYTAMFGIFESILQRSAHLGFALLLTFAAIKPFKKYKKLNIGWYDILFMLLTLGSFGYIVYNAGDIASRMAYVEPLSTIDIAVGVTAIILLIEATRRTVGWALTIILLLFLSYTLWGDNLPGLLAHRHFSLEWVVEQLYFTSNGVLGIPLGVSATFIFMFILFGKFLEVSGAGQFFIDLAISGMGKYRGGPAKTAVVASSILGTISGSAVANTVTTGAFTIPLMKKTGYRGEFAAAVEAVSSSGGQIMPPIMGASAFIIASYLGMPYIEVAAAALIPALLYYLCLFFQVDFRALRRGLRGVPKNELPDMKKVIKQGFLFFAPLILIVYLLIIGFSPMRAGLFAIVTVIVVAAVKTATRLKLKLIIKTLDVGARAAVETAIATAAAGMVIGLISLTGLGLKFSSLIINLAGGSLLLTLIFTMISSIILGMGLPTVAAYIVQVALTVPALIELGVTPLAAHMFVFYFAIISAITPPVALAAFAGAGIAGSDPMRTGMIALRLGIGAFIVPYMFIYGPSILLIGTPLEIFLTLISAIIGIYGIAAGAEGWLKRDMKWWERVIIIASSLTLIKPGLITDVIGFFGVAFIFLLHRVSTRKTNLSIQAD